MSAPPPLRLKHSKLSGSPVAAALSHDRFTHDMNMTAHATTADSVAFVFTEGVLYGNCLVISIFEVFR